MVQTSTVNPNEFLAFRVGEEVYGIEIQKIQELRGYDAVTRIVNAPEFVKGVSNLRGTIVPIFDMRIKFGFESPTYDQFTVVIILNVAGGATGVVVDSVLDVLNLTSEQIKPAPQLGTMLDSNYIVGVGMTEAGMLILLDIEKLILELDLNVLREEIVV